MKLLSALVLSLLLACGEDDPIAETDAATFDGAMGAPDGSADDASDRDARAEEDAAIDAPPDSAAEDDAEVDADVAPAFDVACAVVAEPISVFGACSGICEPDIVADGDGFVLGFTLAAQRIDLDGERIGEVIDLHEPDATAGFANVRLAVRGESLWAFTQQRPSEESSGSQPYFARVEEDGPVEGRALGPLFAEPLAIVASDTGFGVAWSQGYASGSEGIVVASLDEGGAIVEDALEQRTGIPFAGAHMDILATEDGYLACRASTDGLWLYEITRDGAPSEPTFVAVEGAGEESPRCSVTRVGDRLVATLTSDDVTHFVHGNVDDLAALTVSPVDEMRSAWIAANTGGVGAAYRSLDTLGFVLVDAEGTLVAAPITVQPTLGTFRSRPKVVAAADGTFGVAWRQGASIWFARVACDSAR